MLSGSAKLKKINLDNEKESKRAYISGENIYVLIAPYGNSFEKEIFILQE